MAQLPPKVSIMKGASPDLSAATYQIHDESHTVGNALRWMLMKKYPRLPRFLTPSHRARLVQRWNSAVTGKSPPFLSTSNADRSQRASSSENVIQVRSNTTSHRSLRLSLHWLTSMPCARPSRSAISTDVQEGDYERWVERS
ncbi:hypothetical protein B0H14DRAFT_3489095 [Mycena olivaceomarginata]|nr:hypothetical protein B0H14DRAFT_3489095 [Mycena olivaceomarginata]